MVFDGAALAGASFLAATGLVGCCFAGGRAGVEDFLAGVFFFNSLAAPVVETRSKVDFFAGDGDVFFLSAMERAFVKTRLHVICAQCCNVFLFFFSNVLHRPNLGTGKKMLTNKRIVAEMSRYGTSPPP
jgi:hypothetical protein